MTQNNYGVVILGSGIAGLSCALRLAEQNIPSVVLTKREAINTASSWAQGGVAAVVASEDSFESHLEDTCRASSQSTNRKMARKIIEKGPVVIDWLSHLGVPFTREKNGKLALGQEGGHSYRRIVHAEDATGSHIMKALCAAIEKDSRIKIISNVEAVNLQLMHENLKLVELDDTHGNRHQIQTSHLIIATGGFSGLYSRTTSPARGTGIALAELIGCKITNLEFVQFHPTALFGENTNLYLISEALRGEGAILRDLKGNAFMKDFHPDRELAPRDVVAIASMREMKKTGAAHVWLDVRHLSNFAERFPTIHASCIAHGIHPDRELIPVAPASHYASGGVRVDLNGRTSVNGLYACGETACSGVHGANRLASNSLLEGLVFSARIAADIAAHLPAPGEPIEDASPSILLNPQERVEIQRSMSKGAGVVRSSDSLVQTTSDLTRIEDRKSNDPCVEAWETTNLFQLAQAIVKASLIRQETRGSHWREDFPHPSDAWRKRIVQRMDSAGNWSTHYNEVER